jgi:hypothetical protein
VSFDATLILGFIFFQNDEESSRELPRKWSRDHIETAHQTMQQTPPGTGPENLPSLNNQERPAAELIAHASERQPLS